MLKTYEISGRGFTQAPLTLSRLQRLARLVADLGLSSLGGEGSPGVAGALRLALDNLTSGQVPAEFFGIILTGEADGVDWAEIPAETALEVVEDFLSLNGGIVLRLTGWLKGWLSSQVAAAMSATTSMPSSTDSTTTTP